MRSRVIVCHCRSGHSDRDSGDCLEDEPGIRHRREPMMFEFLTRQVNSNEILGQDACIRRAAWQSKVRHVTKLIPGEVLIGEILCASFTSPEAIRCHIWQMSHVGRPWLSGTCASFYAKSHIGNSRMTCFAISWSSMEGAGRRRIGYKGLGSGKPQLCFLFSPSYHQFTSLHLHTAHLFSTFHKPQWVKANTRT